MDDQSALPCPPRGRGPTDNLRERTWFRRGSRVGHVRRFARHHERGAPSDTPSRSNGHRPPLLVPAARPPDPKLGRTPLTPGPVVDEQLPPAGPVSTVEGQSLRSRPHSMENPPCA